MLGALIYQTLRYSLKIVVLVKSFFNYQSGGSQYQILKESHLTKTVNTSPLTERQKHLQHGKKREEFLANNSSVPHDRYCCPELVEEVVRFVSSCSVRQDIKM